MWEVYAAAVMFCILLFVACHRWLEGLAKVRHAQDTPTSKIRSAAQGFVELEGIARPVDGQPLLQANLTRTPCLWWSYCIQIYKYKKNDSGWTTIESGSKGDELCLVDDTGQCRINLQGARIIEHEKKIWKGRTSDPRTPDQRSALRKFFSRRYRYIESVLLPGRELYALGDFRSDNGQHLLQAPTDGRPFILSGKGEPKAVADGRMDMLIGAVLILISALGVTSMLWVLW